MWCLSGSLSSSTLLSLSLITTSPEAALSTTGLGLGTWFRLGLSWRPGQKGPETKCHRRGDAFELEGGHAGKSHGWRSWWGCLNSAPASPCLASPTPCASPVLGQWGTKMSLLLGERTWVVSGVCSLLNSVWKPLPPSFSLFLPGSLPRLALTLTCELCGLCVCLGPWSWCLGFRVSLAQAVRPRPTWNTDLLSAPSPWPRPRPRPQLSPNQWVLCLGDSELAALDPGNQMWGRAEQASPSLSRSLGKPRGRPSYFPWLASLGGSSAPPHTLCFVSSSVLPLWLKDRCELGRGGRRDACKYVQGPQETTCPGLGSAGPLGAEGQLRPAPRWAAGATRGGRRGRLALGASDHPALPSRPGGVWF